MSEVVNKSDSALARDQGVAPEAQRRSDAPARLLLADDDDEIATLMSRILARQGWQVVRVGDGSQAVSAWPAEGTPFDLVILDIYMPRKNGYQAYQELRKLHPEARFLFVSGWFSDDSCVKRVIDEGLPYLLKPFAPQDLISTVRLLLRAQSLSGASRT